MADDNINVDISISSLSIPINVGVLETSVLSSPIDGGSSTTTGTVVSGGSP